LVSVLDRAVPGWADVGCDVRDHGIAAPRRLLFPTPTTDTNTSLKAVAFSNTNNRHQHQPFDILPSYRPNTPRLP
jgi:hypothetical protein